MMDSKTRQELIRRILDATPTKSVGRRLAIQLDGLTDEELMSHALRVPGPEIKKEEVAGWKSAPYNSQDTSFLCALRNRHGILSSRIARARDDGYMIAIPYLVNMLEAIEAAHKAEEMYQAWVFKSQIRPKS